MAEKACQKLSDGNSQEMCQEQNRKKRRITYTLFKQQHSESLHQTKVHYEKTFDHNTRWHLLLLYGS